MPRSNWTPEIGCLILAGALGLQSQAYAQTATYKYDTLGRLIEVGHPSGAKTTYAYDAAGNRVTVLVDLTSPPPPPPPPPSSGSMIPWLAVVLG
jgi:YD repeat-containing protein